MIVLVVVVCVVVLVVGGWRYHTKKAKREKREKKEEYIEQLIDHGFEPKCEESKIKCAEETEEVDVAISVYYDSLGGRPHNWRIKWADFVIKSESTALCEDKVKRATPSSIEDLLNRAEERVHRSIAKARAADALGEMTASELCDLPIMKNGDDFVPHMRVEVSTELFGEDIVKVPISWEEFNGLMAKRFDGTDGSWSNPFKSE